MGKCYKCGIDTPHSFTRIPADAITIIGTPTKDYLCQKCSQQNQENHEKNLQWMKQHPNATSFLTWGTSFTALGFGTIFGSMGNILAAQLSLVLVFYYLILGITFKSWMETPKYTSVKMGEEAEK